MNTKSNRILLGVIILLFGLVSLVQNAISLNYRDIFLIVSGLAFLLLYRTKKNSLALIAGSYLFSFGAAAFAGQMFPFLSISRAIVAVFFITPGVIFLTLYYDKNIQPLLVPASLLIWFGAFILLLKFPLFSSAPAALFFICIGLAFAMMFLIGKYFIGKFPLYLGFILICVGILLLIGNIPVPVLGFSHFKLLPRVGSLILIVVSIFIIASALRKK